MKLIYLTTTPLPATTAHSIQIMYMCDAFVRTGHQVELVAPGIPGPLSADPFEYYDLPARFNVRRIGTLAPGAGSSRRLVSHLLYLWRAARYLRTQQYDTLYAREMGFAQISMFFRDYFLEVHALPRRAGFLHRRKWQRARGIVVITERLKELLAAEGVAEERLFVAPDGVDLDRFAVPTAREEARRALELPREGRLVVYTGSLYGWKGVQTLARAAPLLPPAVTTLFVGGSEKDAAAFRQQHADDRIRVIGHRPYHEVPLYLAAADVLVLPNSGHSAMSRHYTSPLKLFEYMASGRPIVASDLPSLREILDEQAAVLVPSDDANALANRINAVLEDACLATRLGDRARELAQAYTWTARANRIVGFLERMSGRKVAAVTATTTSGGAWGAGPAGQPR
jgi:glycosyltransferase involved in cell wall biosynthesis